MPDRLAVQVAYATPRRQRVIRVTLDAPCTVEQAVRRSGILGEFPEIALERSAVGIFGRVVRRDRLVGDGDRVEIYRPLVADPKERRRRRAQTHSQSSEPGSSA